MRVFFVCFGCFVCLFYLCFLLVFVFFAFAMSPSYKDRYLDCMGLCSPLILPKRRRCKILHNSFNWRYCITTWQEPRRRRRKKKKHTSKGSPAATGPVCLNLLFWPPPRPPQVLTVKVAATDSYWKMAKTPRCLISDVAVDMSVGAEGLPTSMVFKNCVTIQASPWTFWFCPQHFSHPALVIYSQASTSLLNLLVNLKDCQKLGLSGLVEPQAVAVVQPAWLVVQLWPLWWPRLRPMPQQWTTMLAGRKYQVLRYHAKRQRHFSSNHGVWYIDIWFLLCGWFLLFLFCLLFVAGVFFVSLWVLVGLLLCISGTTSYGFGTTSTGSLLQYRLHLQ